jgi:hypothetical protein
MVAGVSELALQAVRASGVNGEGRRSKRLLGLRHPAGGRP